MMNMPASPEYYEMLRDLLRGEKRSRERQDKILDAWLDASTMATDYDAVLWGFESDWMSDERHQLEMRAINARMTHQEQS